MKKIFNLRKLIVGMFVFALMFNVINPTVFATNTQEDYIIETATIEVKPEVVAHVPVDYSNEVAIDKIEVTVESDGIVNAITADVNERINFGIEWSINVDMKENDIFYIDLHTDFVTIDERLTIHDVIIDDNYPNVLDEEGNLIAYWGIVEKEGKLKLKFIALSGINDLTEITGRFDMGATVKEFDALTKNETISIGDVNIAATYNNPGYTPEEDKEPPLLGDFEGLVVDDVNRLPILKTIGSDYGFYEYDYAGTTMYDGLGKKEWIATFGADVLKASMPHSVTSYVDASVPKRENVIITDTLQDGMVFDNIQITSLLYEPANTQGDMSSTETSDINLYIQPVEIRQGSLSFDEWKEKIENHPTPAYGRSNDKKTYILNLGTIGDNGLTYGKDNQYIESTLRSKKDADNNPLYTENEMIAMMKSIGFDQTGYVFAQGSANEQVIDIDSYGNGQVLAYKLYLRVAVTPNDDVNYENTISFTSTQGVFEDTADQTIFVKEYDAYIFRMENEGGPKPEEDKSSIKLTMYNDKNEILSGVEFELRDSLGNVLEKQTTDENGVLFFMNYELGEYTLVQTKTVEGYDIDSLVLYDEIGNVVINEVIQIDSVNKLFVYQAVNKLTQQEVVPPVVEPSNPSDHKNPDTSYRIEDIYR